MHIQTDRFRGGGSPPPLAPNAFREALGRFASGITVMTTNDAEEGRYGVTATSFSSLSLDPPLVQWSLRNTAYSLPIFLRAGCFSVNILAADQTAISRRFATPDTDRFAGLDVTEGLAGMPLIDGAAAWIECTLESTLPGGDHTILIGRVVRAETFAKTPLLYWRGSYLPIESSATPPEGTT
ncbi:flavin reductase family protein [Mesorhizobium sediminum]|nr:flavin reductase family protein [Mesorhizobium sediminum]NRC57379.1 flavin reductase family protein [Mesorhizobium sediminum]